MDYRQSSGFSLLLASILFCLAAPASSAVLTYPGAAPCNTTLQACIDGAASGDTIEIATAGPIDETLDVPKSLTLRPAAGFAPVIGGGATTRRLDMDSLGSLASNETVVIEGLTFSNARVDGFITQATGHSITIRNCVFDFEFPSNNTPAIGLDYRVPGSMVIEGNRITSTGQGMRIFAILDPGSVDILVERNIITTSLPAESNAGIDFDFRGTGTYTARAFSNVVHGVGGCMCGGNGGIVMDIVTGPTVIASINNNTVDRTETADGIEVLVRDPGAVLTLNLFNNSVSNSERDGFRLNNFGGGTVTLNADANNSFMNANGDDFMGLPAGNLTNFPPQYVNVATADYRLEPGSQLINAGIDAPTGGTSTLDAGGDPRILGPQIDIGAYEQAVRSSAAIPAMGPLGLILLGSVMLLAALMVLRLQRST